MPSCANFGPGQPWPGQARLALWPGLPRIFYPLANPARARLVARLTPAFRPGFGPGQPRSGQVPDARVNKPLRMTKEDEEEFQKANECHICNNKYTNEDIKVRDHCHITGKYRGSAHQECNLKLRVKPEEIKIPVIFHNLRGYDSHFIMQEIGEIVKKHTYINKNGKKTQMNINAIPNNMEKYMAFMLGNHLTFLDSFQFMSSGLEKLVSNLPKKSLKYTSQKFKGKKLDLMARKEVYPYDSMDSFDKFNEKLPMKEEFYSVLNNEHI